MLNPQLSIWNKSNKINNRSRNINNNWSNINFENLYTNQCKASDQKTRYSNLRPNYLKYVTRTRKKFNLRNMCSASSVQRKCTLIKMTLPVIGTLIRHIWCISQNFNLNCKDTVFNGTLCILRPCIAINCISVGTTHHDQALSTRKYHLS